VLETEAKTPGEAVKPAQAPRPPAAVPPVLPLPQAGEDKKTATRAASREAKQAPQALSVKPLARIAGEAGERRSPEPGEGRRTNPKPLASPAVRQRAWDLGIELQFVPGTGPAGRVTREDLEAYAAGGDRRASVRGSAFAPRDGVDEVPIIGLRRAIAEHMQRAAAHIPHFAYVEEVDVTSLEELRAHLNETHAGQDKNGRSHLTLLPFVMRAIVNAIVDHPQVNAHFDDENGVLYRYRAVHIGVATQTPGGLMVPVAHHAETLDLWQTAAEIQRLSEAARTGKATRAELTGSTITVTSLGRLGGLMATPVINHPEVAIVGVNRIDERPVVRGGQVVLRKMMNLSSSFDHRIVDGWEAASFIAKVKAYLEQPATLFIE
ncbi:MAG TPA: dihydrolipoamide acetyltransferase family protein, partial [Stellaceae bacterium]|nr:dihydrolipoamide acetyltransferase family protein [Stellaceae bacterium]